MRLFAVILASIAAIAATAQAYLFWTYLEGVDAYREGIHVDGNRRGACSRLITATSEFARFSDKADEYYAAVLDGERERANRYSRDGTPEEIETEAVEAARVSVLNRFRGGARYFFSFLDEDHIYFSENEIAALGADIYAELPADMDDYITRYETSLMVRNDETYDLTLDAIRRIGELKSQVVEVCTPILRNEAL